MDRPGYYERDLAWVHHVGYSQHAERVAPGIIRLLSGAGLARGALVCDVGCGGGRLARKLLAEGYAVRGFDASPAMIALAREFEPGAVFEVLRLPAGPGGGALPLSDAVVSTGHVLNYLDSRAQISQALAELARAVRPGGVLAIDLMTERFCNARAPGEVHAKVEDDWVIVTRFSRPAPFRFDRAITVFRRQAGQWRRSDEHHANVTFEVDEAQAILTAAGLQVRAGASFGDEQLLEGLAVLVGARR